jgi:hypothetical protein
MAFSQNGSRFMIPHLGRRQQAGSAPGYGGDGLRPFPIESVLQEVEPR